MKKARIEIHKILDPMWKPDKNKRRKIYSALSEFLGRKYHTADLRSIEEARDIYRQILKLKKNNFLLWEEYIQFLNIALDSLRELDTQLIIAKEVDLIKKRPFHSHSQWS